jgi:transposase
MRFYTHQHQFYCGIDLHARSMYLCIMEQSGKVLLHKNYPANPVALKEAITPYREDLVVAVECIFTWYWIADLCNREGIAFVLGHALYMKAIHGGKTKNDKIDSHKIAALLRSGMLPMAYVYPQKMRSTRDLLRRRLYLARQHAELQAHIQNTNTQYNLPYFEKRIDRRSNRTGIGLRFKDPAVRTSVDVDVALMDALHEQILTIERRINTQVPQHDPVAVHLLRSIPGVGKTLALVILYETHDINRFPTVGNFISYARLVKCTHESAGKRKTGTNNKIGNVHLKWAFSEAACLFLRRNELGKRYHQRLVGRYGKAKALSILAQKLGRTVYTILKRRTPFDAKRFFETVG